MRNILENMSILLNYLNNLIQIIGKWLFDIPNNPDKSIFMTIINISVTGFILLITLSIYPFQKISETLSGNLYNYFLSNKKFKTPLLVNLFLCLFQVVIFPFVSDCKFVLIIYILCLIIILLNIFNYSQAIKEQLDLTKSCYPIIEESLKKEIEEAKKIELESKKNPHIAYDEASDLLIDALLFQSNVNKYPLGKPFPNYDKVFIYKIHNVYDLLYDALINLKYSTFEKSVESLFNCLNIYFSYIENHSIVVDNVFLDFLDISKIILDKASEKKNNLYSDIFLGNFRLLVKDISKLNINKDFYYSKLIDFYAINVVPYNKQYLNSGLSLLGSLEVQVFTQEEFLLESFEIYYSYLVTFKDFIYKTNNSTNRSAINKLINSFCFDCISNTAYFFDRKTIEKLIALQKTIKTENTAFQIPGANDFSTMIPIKGTDKTISALISLLLKNEKFNGSNSKYKISIIRQLIDILEDRYLSSGYHLEGITSQLFRIIFEISSLFNPILYALYNSYSLPYVPISKTEEAFYISIIEQIVFFNLKNSRSGNKDLLFSELKLFLIVLARNNNNNLKNYIYRNTYKLLKAFVYNKNISDDIQIEIYKYVIHVIPCEDRCFLKYQIKQFYKEIEKERKSWKANGLPIMFKDSYDIKTFSINELRIPHVYALQIKEYINIEIFDYFLFKRCCIKKDILALPKKTKLKDLPKLLNNLDNRLLNIALLEMQIEKIIEIDSKYIKIL